MNLFLENILWNYKRVIVSILCILSFQLNFSQTTISGKIVDDNNEPLPFVHLRIEKTNIGTISNEIGLFKLVSNSTSKNVRVVISAIGYSTKIVSLNEGVHRLSLSQSITELNEVVLVPRDYGKELIQKVINAIPNNYPKKEEQHTGFFRETTTWKNEETPIYIAEAVIESNKKAYTKTKKSGDVKLVEFRKYESEQLDSLITRIRAGSHHIHRFDIVSRREAFLSNPNGYKYKIKDTLWQDGNDIYKVYFEKKEKVSGYLYIMASSFAIIKADFNRHSNSFFELAGRNRQFLNYTTTYEQSEDQIWRFKHSYYKTAFKENGRILNLISEYVTTDIQNKKVDIPYVEKLQFDDILLDESEEYKSNFWNNYNIISPDETSEALFKSIDYSKQVNNKKQSSKLIRFLSNLKYEIALTWGSVDTNPYMLTFDNSILDIQQDGLVSQKSSLSYTTSIFYKIKPNFFIGYANESKISKTGITSHDLVMATEFNINPNSRPILISPRMNVGYQQVENLIGDYNVDEEFKIAGRKFNSDKVDVFLSQRSFRIKPNVSLIIEKSRRISFLVSLGYNFQISEKEGVLFHEKNGIFQKKAFLENREQNLLIQSNQGALLENTITVGVGISFKL